MRVRTAHVTVERATGLRSFFELAVERHLAWAFGHGRVYADLEKVANKHGYRVWSTDPGLEESDGFWVAVREDLIAEDSWTVDEENVMFDATREGLGEVHLVGDQLFDNRNTVSVVQKADPVEHVGFTYEETLYSAQPLAS